MRKRIRSASVFAVFIAVFLGIALPFSGVFAARKSAVTAPIVADAVAPDADNSAAARLNSIGVAYMNQQRFADAQKQFDGALKTQPDYSLAKLNLGIALLSQQKSDDAKKALLEATEKLPRDPYAWYNLGLVYKDVGEQEKAIAAFQRVTEIAPSEPDAFYFIGYLNSQLQKYDAAIAAFQSALAVFPFHASAEFGLARAYQRKGDTENARVHLQKFQKITSQHLGAPFGAGYGDQGKFSLAEYAKNGSLKAPAAIPVSYVAQAISTGPSSGACFFDYDGDGKPDLVLVSASENDTLRLLHNIGDGKFEDKTSGSGLTHSGSGLGCAAGDFDNDGKTDLAVCMSDGVHLFHNAGAGKFSDVTKAVNIRSEKGCVGVTFADYDHDGDLDLYISNKPGDAGRNVMWRNNGNSTFTDVSAETALGTEATGAGMVTSDFNNDRAVDFILAGGAKGASVLLNPREGEFKALAGIDFAKEGLPPALGVVSFDFDKDGWMDLAFTHAGAPGISLWRNKDGKVLERVALPDLGWQRGWGISSVDYDNDGWIDLVAVGESNSGGELSLLRNLGAPGFADVTRQVYLDTVKLSQPRAVAVADITGNGAADLVITQLGTSPILLRNEGGNKHNWTRVDLKALNDNKSAIGTKVEIYAGPLYQKWEVQGASGYLGQNATTILAGLGTERNVEVVRLLWPTGGPQDESNLAANKEHSIVEL